MIIPETYFSFSEHTQLFIYSCISGAILGIVYDIFRTFRIIFPHNSLLVMIEDVLFAIIYVIFTVSFTSAFARGEFRIFYIFGNILGFTLYFFTIGRIAVLVIRKLIGIITNLILFLFRPFCLIYALMCKKFHKKFGSFNEFFLKRIKIFFFHLIDMPRMLYNSRVIHKRKNVKKNVRTKSKKSKAKSEKKSKDKKKELL